jgi:hypothetical protein
MCTHRLTTNQPPPRRAGLKGKLGRLPSGLISIAPTAPEAGTQEARQQLERLLAGEGGGPGCDGVAD